MTNGQFNAVFRAIVDSSGTVFVTDTITIDLFILFNFSRSRLRKHSMKVFESFSRFISVKKFI